MILLRAPWHQTVRSWSSGQSNPSGKTSTTCSSSAPSSTQIRRRSLLSTSIITSTTTLSPAAALFSFPAPSFSSSEFSELPDSGGERALDLRIGTGSGSTPLDGDQVAIHYYGRLGAKQGWRFDSTYDHKDSSGESVPFTFILGSGKVISGIEAAVRSMKVGGVRRVIIPPSRGYQNTSQEPLPPNPLSQGYPMSHYKPREKGYQSPSRTLRNPAQLQIVHKAQILRPPPPVELGWGAWKWGARTIRPLAFSFFDRQRLFTTIFNPTRLANGEGSTLGTLIFDIELVSVKH